MKQQGVFEMFYPNVRNVPMIKKVNTKLIYAWYVWAGRLYILWSGTTATNWRTRRFSIIMQIYAHSTLKPPQNLNLHNCIEYTFVFLPKEDKNCTLFPLLFHTFYATLILVVKVDSIVSLTLTKPHLDSVNIQHTMSSPVVFLSSPYSYHQHWRLWGDLSLNPSKAGRRYFYSNDQARSGIRWMREICQDNVNTWSRDVMIE